MSGRYRTRSIYLITSGVCAEMKAAKHLSHLPTFFPLPTREQDLDTFL